MYSVYVFPQLLAFQKKKRGGKKRKRKTVLDSATAATSNSLSLLTVGESSDLLLDTTEPSLHLPRSVGGSPVPLDEGSSPVQTTKSSHLVRDT